MAGYGAGWRDACAEVARRCRDWGYLGDVGAGIAVERGTAGPERGFSTSYEVPDGPKKLRETLCVAQASIGASDLDQDRKREHMDRLQRLIDACDAHRPFGPDGKHGGLHTATCGCEETTEWPEVSL